MQQETGEPQAENRQLQLEVADLRSSLAQVLPPLPLPAQPGRAEWGHASCQDGSVYHTAGGDGLAVAGGTSSTQLCPFWALRMARPRGVRLWPTGSGLGAPVARVFEAAAA